MIDTSLSSSIPSALCPLWLSSRRKEDLLRGILGWKPMWVRVVSISCPQIFNTQSGSPSSPIVFEKAGRGEG
ncbi:hypothetical protein EON65_55355 [archaeon]|nr:MAG: hypothetical protein EON65_55355 [archaeon]